MKSTRIVIVEDEYSIAMDMEMRLENMGHHVVGIACHYQELLPLLMEEEIDIVLLDINLNADKDGIEIAKLIDTKFELPVVFITAYTDEETFNQAIEVKPAGFITKPYKDADLRNTIRLALEKTEIKNTQAFSVEESKTSIFVKDKGVVKQVALNSILWLEAMDNYTVLFTEDQKMIVHAFLKDVLAQLGNDFIRIHRSHAVSLKRITTLEDNTVYIGDKFLAVSNNYKQELLDRMKII